jgi:hypothetical protein
MNHCTAASSSGVSQRSAPVSPVSRLLAMPKRET